MPSDSPEKVTAHSGVARIKPHMAEESSDRHPPVRIDISSNESAYGPSLAAVSAIHVAVPEVLRYGETAVSDLQTKIAEVHGLNPEGIVCGHGSDDLLLRIAQTFLQPGDELIYSSTGYQRIPNLAHTANAKPIRAADRNFAVDVDQILSHLSDRTRVVMVANPDNPTGTYLSGWEVRRLHESLPSNVLLVLDSAYLEYAEADDFENPKALIEQSDNVIMTRTFSKIHGLAGIRLGWAYSTPPIAESITKMGMSFPISNLACSAGLAALDSQQHVNIVIMLNQKVRSEFSATLRRMGVEVIPSQTNFVLARFRDPSHSATDAYHQLRSQGIRARRFASESFSECIRFTLGVPDEMTEVIDVLEKFLTN